MKWENAQSLCRKYGGDLALVEDNQENNIILEAVSGLTKLLLNKCYIRTVLNNNNKKSTQYTHVMQ